MQPTIIQFPPKFVLKQFDAALTWTPAKIRGSGISRYSSLSSSKSNTAWYRVQNWAYGAVHFLSLTKTNKIKKQARFAIITFMVFEQIVTLKFSTCLGNQNDHFFSFFKQVQNIWPEKAAFQGATLPLVLSTKQDVDSPEHSPAPHGWWWGSVGVWREVPEATPVAPVTPAPQWSDLPLQLIGVQLQLRLQEAHLISVTHATTTSTHHVATHSTPSHRLLVHLLPSCHDGAASATPSVIAPASCNTTMVLKSHSGHLHNLYHPETTWKQVI